MLFQANDPFGGPRDVYNNVFTLFIIKGLKSMVSFT